MEWILFKTLLSLAAVLGLMVGVVYLLKKYVYRGAPGGANDVAVEILGQRALHPKRSIVVVKVLDTIFVVGMSEQGMQTLGTIDNEQSLAALADRRVADDALHGWAAKKPVSFSSAFAGQLQESLKGLFHRGVVADPIIQEAGNDKRPAHRPRKRQ